MNDYLQINNTEILVEPVETVVTLLQPSEPTVIVISEGIQGPPGPPGPPGEVIGASQFYYEFQQLTPLQTWIVNHNLGNRPNIAVYTVGGMQVIAEVQHSSTNQARIYFDQPIAGFAICS